MTASDPVVRRWTTAAVVVVASLAVAVAGLLHGVEVLVWDPVHRTYAYVERPHATAVTWGAAAVALSGLVGAGRLLRRR